MGEQELQVEKLRGEVEKLKLELKNLQQPLRAYLLNPASYLTALTALIGVLAFVGQSYVKDAQAEYAKAQLERSELRKEKLQQEQGSLQQGKEKLQQEQASLKEDKARLEADYSQLGTAYQEMQGKRDVLKAEIDSLSAKLTQLQAQAGARPSAAVEAAVAQAQKLQVSSKATLLDARIYIQVPKDSDQPDATRLAALLKAPGTAVPPIEVVGAKAANLAQSELRYFWKFDAEEAAAIARKVEAAGGYGKVALRLPSSLEGKTRPRHFELWLKP